MKANKGLLVRLEEYLDFAPILRAVVAALRTLESERMRNRNTFHDAMKLDFRTTR
jgi:hypothetical protein